MRLYLYKNGLCDPAKNIGVARLFSRASDIDEYLQMFCASAKPETLKNWRAFITNNEVEFTEVDHYVLMGDPLGIVNKVKEVDLYEIAGVVNRILQEKEKRRQAALERAKKVAENKPRI